MVGVTLVKLDLENFAAASRRCTGGMTKYRKGPQKTHKEPQMSVTQDHRIGNHEKTARLQQFCLSFKIILFIF